MRIFATMAFIVLVAGCASEAPAKVASGPSVAATAAAVVTSEVGGSIHGLVVDEELVPIGGASVAITKTELVVQTAKNGEFTINEVPAGSHAVFVNALGYESASKKVDVADGAASEVRFELRAVAVVGDPYSIVYRGVFFMQFDWFGVGQAAAVHPYLCTPCDVYQSIAKGATAGFLEASYTKSVPLPSFSDTILYQVYTKPRNETFVTGDRVVSGALADRAGVAVGEDGVKLLSKADLISVQVLSGGLTQVAVQQRCESLLSIGYNGELPETYTALPPP